MRLSMCITVNRAGITTGSTSQGNKMDTYIIVTIAVLVVSALLQGWLLLNLSRGYHQLYVKNQVVSAMVAHMIKELGLLEQSDGSQDSPTLN
jgi:hypothetical protein